MILPEGPRLTARSANVSISSPRGWTSDVQLNDRIFRAVTIAVLEAPVMLAILTIANADE